MDLNKLKVRSVKDAVKSLHCTFVISAISMTTSVTKREYTTVKNVAFVELEAKTISITVIVAVAAWANIWKTIIHA